MAALNLTQMTAVVGVLARAIDVPFRKKETGIFLNDANQIVVPLNTFNNALGTNLTSSQDGTNAYITLNVGDNASGRY